MVLLFRDFYEKSYKVPMCSGVACVWLVFFIIVVVTPWIACWRAGGKSNFDHIASIDAFVRLRTQNLTPISSLSNL